jgi:phosphohistidine phosphatase
VKLYFLRHGEAGNREDWRGDDNLRPLTKDGIKKMQREAETIAKLDLDLDLILTSPLVRAKQTAEIVATELDLEDRLIEDDDLGLDFNFERLRAIIASRRDAQAIMLVGHEPSMSQTLGQLVGVGKIELKKGALAGVKLVSSSSASGELICLVPAKVLAR